MGMSKIIALILVVAAAIAFWSAPTTSYGDVAKDILHPYAASVVEQPGQLRGQLDDAGKQLYDVVKAGLLAHEREIVVRRIGYDQDDIWRVVWSVYYDTPELFWADFRTLSFRDTNEGFAVLPTYFFAKEETEQRRAAFNDAANKLLEALDEKNFSNDYDKVLFLHDELIGRIRYDEKADDAVIHTAYGALVDSAAVCDGYARAFHYLCLCAGVECYYVEGSIADNTDPDVGHAWNLVGLDGAYHYVDVTWDDGDYEHGDDAPPYPVVSHSYFLVGEDALTKTHVVNKKFDMPVCTDYGYFEKAGLSAAAFETIEDAVADALYANIKGGARYYVEFSITDAGEFDKVVGSYEYAVGGIIETVNEALDDDGLTLIDEYGEVSFSYREEQGDILAMFTPE